MAKQIFSTNKSSPFFAEHAGCILGTTHPLGGKPWKNLGHERRDRSIPSNCLFQGGWAPISGPLRGLPSHGGGIAAHPWGIPHVRGEAQTLLQSASTLIFRKKTMRARIVLMTIPTERLPRSWCSLGEFPPASSRISGRRIQPRVPSRFRNWTSQMHTTASPSGRAMWAALRMSSHWHHRTMVSSSASIWSCQCYGWTHPSSSTPS